MLTGFEDNEDCGAMLLSTESEYAILSSVDFITPVVDDPYIYGQIAAANALSDIFAMGGRALSALNLLMWDSTHFDSAVANAILGGDTGYIGDLLVLTKPIGSGILTTAIKARMLEDKTEVIRTMSMLNLYAAKIAQNYEIHACTDITGFGLIGHGIEMCGKINNEKSVLFYTQQIPLFEGIKSLAQIGIVPGGSYENKNALQGKVTIQCELEDDIFY